MTIGLLAEQVPEKRVGLTPENVAALLKLGVEKIMIEKGAGEGSYLSDTDYTDQGGTIATREEVIKGSDVLVMVNDPGEDSFNIASEEKVFLGGFNPLSDNALVARMQAKNLTVFSLDIIPRTTRAQAMDILSSMATVAGYKAVLMAASHLPNFFPMFMTAAGTITPAKVLVLGAGVAGLQAIATAKRLGAVVEAFDVRAAAKEEVLSLGAKFVDVEGATDDTSAGGYAVEQSDEFKKRQAEKVQEHAAKSSVIICTAQIPGRNAPVLVTAETVAKMKAGSVIVDLAASTGGNCELTEDAKICVKEGVTIIGDSSIAASMPADASKMFGKNVVNFLKIMIKDGQLNLDFEDDLIAGTCVTKGKEIINERLKNIMAKTTA